MDESVESVLPPFGLSAKEKLSYPGLSALPDAAVRKTASDAAIYTFAMYSAQALLFVAGVIQKRLLGPTEFGYWALISTLQIFFTLATLGTLDGAGRQIPFHRGREDRDRAASVANTAGSFAVLATAIAGLTLAIVSLSFGSHWRPEIRYGLALIGVIAPFSQLSAVHTSVLAAVKRFDAISLSVVLQAAISLTLQSLLVVLFGFYGMFAGLALGGVSSLVLWNRLGLTSFRSPAFRWRIRRARLLEVMRYGIPIMLQGQIWQLFLVVDNLIVATFIDVRHLGYYAVACSATTYIMLLPQAVGAALAPRMSERFGKTGKEGDIRHYATEVQRLLSQLLLPVMVGAAFFLMPVLIREALPQFTPAISIVRIMVAGSFLIALSTMPIKLLLAAGYRWSVAALTLLSLAINALANYLAVGIFHDGLPGAAYAVVLSYFATFLVMTGFALTRTIRLRATVLHVAQILGVFAYTIAALWGIESLIGSGAGNAVGDILTGFAKLALLLVVLSPWFALAEARFNGLTMFSSLIGGAINKLGGRHRDA